MTSSAGTPVLGDDCSSQATYVVVYGGGLLDISNNEWRVVQYQMV